MLKSGEKLRKLLMLLATWGLLLACFIAYERYFVTGQRDFLKEDGFRALTTLSGELNAQIQKAQKSSEASLKLAVPDSKQDVQKPDKILTNRDRILTNFVTLYVTETSISLNDVKSCSQRSRGKPVPSTTKITPVRNKLALSISCYDSEQSLYTVDLVKGVSKAFEKQSGHFDDVLIADESGNVIYQKSVNLADPSLSKSGTKPQITNLSSLLPSEPKKQDAKKTSEKSAEDKAPDAGEKSKENSVTNPDDRIRRLLGSSAFTEVTAAGKTYEMFSRPVPIQFPGGTSWNLVVIGLWDAQQFDESSRRIPYSALIWAGLIAAALLSLSWPLFKLRFMSKTERFTPADGWYLVLALFLAATSVMLMLLNASYNAHERDKSDEDLQKLTQLIKSNLKNEIETAVHQLDKLTVPPKVLQSTFRDLQGDFLTQQDLLKGSSSFPSSAVDFPYLYFDSAFWVETNGWQHYKVDVRSTPTPIINVTNRPYFQRAVSENAKQMDEHYLQPILTRSTDEFEVDVAGLYSHHEQTNLVLRDQNGSPLKDKEQIQVEVLSFRPMSLVDPVLPPGYRFAVIDADCNVLFHSESYRNMREDFCEDSLDKNELRPWLFSGVDTPLDISYEGNTQRAYLSTLESPKFALEGSNANSNTTQAFLLVFRKPEIALTLNLAIVLVCAVLMGTYFVVLLLIAAGYLLARKAWRWVYMPQFLFPQRKNAIAYSQIFFANVAILLLFWWFYPRLYEAPLLALTVLVAVVSVFYAISKLALPDRGPLVVGALLGAILLISLVAIPSRAAKDPLDWEYVWTALSAASVIAILLADRVSSVFIRKALSKIGLPLNVVENRFGTAYVFAVLSVITAAGLVPCIGFFKYSYDAVTELALKRDEIEVSERLIHREAAIREYYDSEKLAENHGVKLPVGAEEPLINRRISEHWDRYDSDPKTVAEQRFFIVDKSATKPCEPGDSQPGQNKPTRDDLNEMIERVVANATLALTLPTNSLGSQMSKLGVASTKDASESWEHCWAEPAPTSFQLAWKSTSSRWPNQTVTATYPDWKGLRRWPRIFLVLLWVGLGSWLAIVLKEVLLTDLEDVVPLEDLDWTKVADIQQHYLVINQAESGRKLWKQIADLPAANRLDLRIELKKMVEDKTYSPTWEKSVPLLILDHFDFNMKDDTYNLARLNLVENLLCASDLKLLIISTIDPLYSLTDDAADILADGKDSAMRRLLGRWAAALSKFRKVHLADVSHPGFADALQAHSNDPVFATRVKQECDHTSKLREIGEAILKEHSGGNTPSREWVVSRVMSLADSYYHALWTRLSSTERLVLYQLARDGWSNPKNLAAVQQLEAKQLVQKDPMYKIINESFRRFVLSPEHADDIAQWVKLEQQSTWHALKFIVIAIGIGFAAWLLYTQAALSQQVVGYIAAIATLLTAAGSLFGRSGKSTPAKAEGD